MFLPLIALESGLGCLFVGAANRLDLLREQVESTERFSCRHRALFPWAIAENDGVSAKPVLTMSV